MEIVTALGDGVYDRPSKSMTHLQAHHGWGDEDTPRRFWFQDTYTPVVSSEEGSSRVHQHAYSTMHEQSCDVMQHLSS
jgi:hypothetical protein